MEANQTVLLFTHDEVDVFVTRGVTSDNDPHRIGVPTYPNALLVVSWEGAMWREAYARGMHTRVRDALTSQKQEEIRTAFFPEAQPGLPYVEPRMADWSRGRVTTPTHWSVWCYLLPRTRVFESSSRSRPLRMLATDGRQTYRLGAASLMWKDSTPGDLTSVPGELHK